MEIFLALCLGIGLSAATGYRISIPFLIINIAHQTGHLSLSQSFQWLGSYPALIVFLVAAVLEIGIFLIPGLDHALDVLAIPSAVIAGTILTASCVTGMSPWLTWTLAIIAGGGTATVAKLASTGIRTASTAFTGGIGNPIVTLAETSNSIFMSIVALFLPVIAAIIFIVVTILIFVFLKRLIKRPEIA